MFVGCGNFGAAPNPPCSASNDCARRVLASSSGLGGDDLVSFGFGLQSVKRLDQCPALLAQVAAALDVEMADPAQDFLEGGEPEARGLWKIGPAEERNPVLVIQKHGERPSTGAPREQVLRTLVDPIQIRALLPVDLDVDKELVHELRGARILKGFVGHDVAPVARGVAHREQDRLPFVCGFLESLFAPRVPVDRVGCVLEEVGTGLGRESVGGRI